MDLLRDEAGADEWSCERLRDRHAEYMDGQLAAAELARVRRHLDECVACARYDRVVRRGLQLARELPEVVPAHDFQVRLQHRIFHLQDGRALAQQRPFAGVGVAAAVASIIAIVAWSPLLLLDTSTPAATRGAAPMTAALPAADPLGIVAVGWYPGQVPALPTQLRAGRPTVFPGPYSPLIVNPPVHGGPVRTVSTEYHAVE